MAAFLLTCSVGPLRIREPVPSISVSSEKRKPVARGYWTSDRVCQDLVLFALEVNKDAQRMPTQRELLLAGRQKLISAIRRHGGWEVVARAAGLSLTSIQRPRSLYLTYCVELKRGTLKPHNYWKEFENLREELRNFIKEHGGDRHAVDEMPTTMTLEKANRSDLVRAIGKHGGMEAVARRMKLRFRYHSKGYWQDFENVIREVKKLSLEEDGKMPSQACVMAVGPPGLSTAIKMHGGFGAVASAVGLPTTRRPRNYWSSLENVDRELREFVQATKGRDTKHKTLLPTQQEMIAAGRGDLVRAIKLCGGMGAAASRLGLEYDPKPWSTRRRVVPDIANGS
mmetsp:Transcript_2394/g.4142  ORF Transcript_2394/g.4142 Transcript_2394/m.4142 type:complete len:340 (-) Transcript_2394:993-2012(-)|eukprot:CAMPEP_0184679596 /NCGR_PEP_ID=MMETSP0312-20130426/2439_1 /TAXON_ID=31354 /ORGANISM="Compsopogon coeruleus, Strain SAG 36.94" /LENGTH=339 /DNA_ID=CAMNT_0027129139 /DNA_START=53 /DNA_END=1072 /DNA_ORIENTATION=+